VDSYEELSYKIWCFGLWQRFPTCGMRTTSGTRRSSRWYGRTSIFSQKPGFHTLL